MWLDRDGDVEFSGVFVHAVALEMSAEALEGRFGFRGVEDPSEP